VFERKVSEPKLDKKSGLMVRTVKQGNRVVGRIEEGTFWCEPPGVRLLPEVGKLVVRKTALVGLSAYGVARVGLRTPDGSSYAVSIKLMAAPALGSDSYLVNLAQCEVTVPPIAERTDTLMGKMRVAGGRKSSVTARS
jgi:hypothetical protein